MHRTKVIMFDQDGVVCDKAYKTTKDIKETISLALAKGIILVPNSDTPWKRLSNNTEVMLGFEPDSIIAEKGAVVKIGPWIIYSANITGVDRYIGLLFDLFSSHGMKVAMGDSATWIRVGKKFEPNSRYIIIDGLRSQSVGFYLLITDNLGTPRIDRNWFEEGLTMARTIELPQELAQFNPNIKYGIVIANNPNITKTNGYRIYKDRIGLDSTFFMIGDSDIDIIDDVRVTHLAVGNTSEGLRRRAAFVSQYDYTAGLEECLQKIIVL